MDAEAAPTPRVFWKKPSSGPKPRHRDDHQHHAPNPARSAAPSRRNELKRRLRASAEAAALALAAAEAARQSDAGARVDEDHGAVQRPGPAGARVDGGHGASQGPGPEGARVDGAHGAVQIPAPEGVPVDGGHGAVQRPWSDADEVALLAAAAAFRGRTGRAPGLPDVGALFDSIRGSISPHIDEPEASEMLKRFESAFLHEATWGSAGAHGRRVRDLCASVWGAAVAAPPPDDDGSCGQEVGGRGADDDERRLAPDAAAMTMRPEVTEVPDECRKKVPPSPPNPSLGRATSHSRSELKRSLLASALSLAAAEVAAGESDTCFGADGYHDAVERLEPAGVPVDAGHGSDHDADEVTLLTAAAAFRERTGRAPRHQDAEALLGSIRGSISEHIDAGRVSYKLRRLKSTFLHKAPGSSASTRPPRA
ncbi:hypothetical protein ACP4OV_000864 [Aristida adscensionis]